MIFKHTQAYNLNFLFMIIFCKYIFIEQIHLWTSWKYNVNTIWILIIHTIIRWLIIWKKGPFVWINSVGIIIGQLLIVEIIKIHSTLCKMAKTIDMIFIKFDRFRKQRVQLTSYKLIRCLFEFMILEFKLCTLLCIVY